MPKKVWEGDLKLSLWIIMTGLWQLDVLCLGTYRTCGATTWSLWQQCELQIFSFLPFLSTIYWMHRLWTFLGSQFENGSDRLWLVHFFIVQVRFMQEHRTAATAISHLIYKIYYLYVKTSYNKAGVLLDEKKKILYQINTLNWWKTVIQRHSKGWNIIFVSYPQSQLPPMLWNFTQYLLILCWSDSV